jgi:hypothetical protein
MVIPLAPEGGISMLRNLAILKSPVFYALNFLKQAGKSM